MKISHIAWRNIRRNTRRSILSASAIAVSAMLFVFLFSLLAGMKQDLSYNLQTFYTGEIKIRNKAFEKYRHLNPLHLSVPRSEEILKEIEKKPWIESTSPRIEFFTAIYHEGINYKARGLGVDFRRERSYQDIDSFIIEGRIPKHGQNEVLIAQGLAEEMGVGVGDRFTLLSKTAGRGLNALSLTVTGISGYAIGDLNKQFFQAPIDRIQYFLRMGAEVSEINLKIKEGYPLDPVKREVQELLPKEVKERLEVLKWTEINETYSYINIADISYSIMALVFFVLGSTVIINTMMMTVYERRKEIGMISAMGMEGGNIIRLFFTEAFFIAVLGSLFGVVAGTILTLITGNTGIPFGNALEGVDFEISSALYPVLTLRSTVFVFFYSTIVASLVSLIPSRASARVKPVEALRSE